MLNSYLSKFKIDWQSDYLKVCEQITGFSKYNVRSSDPFYLKSDIFRQNTYHNAFGFTFC